MTIANSVSLCDSHIHLFRDGFHSTYTSDFARKDELALYESLRAVHHVERALVIGYEGSSRFKGNNGDIANWARSCDWIVPLAYHDCANPPSFAPENAEHDSAFAGISLYVLTPEKARSLAKWPRYVIDALNERQAIISMNAVLGVLAELQPFLAQLDNCFVLISHLGIPGAFLEPPPPGEVRQVLEPLRRLSSLKNIGVKASGLYGVSVPRHDYPHRSAHPFLHQLREDFGRERLFWGSDFSPALEYVSFAQTIDALAHLGWPEADMSAVMGDNLRRILNKRNYT